MGGTSKSSTSQTSVLKDRRIGAADGSVVATEGAAVTTNIDVESVDPEIAQAALTEAFSFGKGAIDFAQQTQGQVVDLAARGNDTFEGFKSLLSTTAIVAVGGLIVFGLRK